MRITRCFLDVKVAKIHAQFIVGNQGQTKDFTGNSLYFVSKPVMSTSVGISIDVNY